MDLGLLHLAARSAGFPLDWMDRASKVQQPAVCEAVRSRFLEKCLALRNLFQASQQSRERIQVADMLNMMNPSGQTWLLLAFPDGTEGDALSMFGEETGGQRAGDAGVHSIALAGPAYEGVAVLAQGLLGSSRSLDSTGAPPTETIFWEERCAGVDPRKWSVGCFRNRDQLLPVFLIHISAALHSDLQGEVNRLKRNNDCLQSRLESQSTPIEKALEAWRSKRRRDKRRAQNCVMGHTRVNVADISQPETSLHRIDFDAEIEEHERQLMEKANGPGKARRTRGKGTPGEMGVVSIFVKLPGAKRKRVCADGTSPGGLEWDNRVLLNAVLLYLLSHTSLKEAGSAGISFLSKLALECFVKAEPRKGHQSRRIDDKTPVPVFKPISRDSVRTGVFALELAKNEEMIEWVRNCQVLNLGHDATTVGSWSVQCVHLRAIKRVYRYTDGAGTRKLGAEARSMCLDLKGSGDKFQTEFLVPGEDGKPRRTLITASANLGAQCHQSGMWYVVSRHHALTMVSDGGGRVPAKGTGTLLARTWPAKTASATMRFCCREQGTMV